MVMWFFVFLVGLICLSFGWCSVPYFMGFVFGSISMAVSIAIENA